MRISRIFYTFLIVGSIVATSASSSFGQPPGGGGGGRRGGFGGMGGGMFGSGGLTGLLRMEEVQKELKIDDDQKKELTTLAEEMMTEMRKFFPQGGPGGGGAGGGGGGRQGGGPPGGFDFEKMRTEMAAAQAKAETKLGEILDPAQLDRLIGLTIQRESFRSFSSKLISERLAITEDQKTKIADIEKASRDKMMALRDPGAPPGPPDAAMMEKFTALQKETETEVMTLLTEKQKSEMEALKGEKFEFPAFQFGPPGGGGGGRGRGGNRGGNGA